MILTSLKSLLQMSLQCAPLVIAFQSSNDQRDLHYRQQKISTDQTDTSAGEKEERIRVKRSKCFSRHCGIACGGQMITIRMLKSGSRDSSARKRMRGA